MKDITPLHISKISQRTLHIHWSDHYESEYDVVDLRKACPCAYCVDELTGKPLLDPTTVSDTVRPTKVRSLGRYALIIDWTDGHTSSIYSWEKLRKLADLV